MRCCQNKTSFSWSYRDSSKKSLDNNVRSRRGGEKYTHFEIGGHVQMAKSDPETQRKSSLLDCTWLEKRVWILNLETFEIPNALQRTGEFTLFYFYELIYIYILFSYIFFLIFFSFLYTHVFFFFSYFIIFLFAPLEL
jgi:hypothetical protein